VPAGPIIAAFAKDAVNAAGRGAAELAPEIPSPDDVLPNA
jgi:hypothetical protein